MLDNPKQKLFLLLSIIGIFTLFAISIFIKPTNISVCKVANATENQYVKVYGVIIREKNLTENFKLLTIKENACFAEITCNCESSLWNKNVSVAGKIQIYNNKTQIQAEEILEN